MEEKKWKAIRGKLSKGYIWETQWAKRRNSKGRAAGGLLLGIKKRIKVQKRDKGTEMEGVME